MMKKIFLMLATAALALPMNAAQPANAESMGTNTATATKKKTTKVAKVKKEVKA